MAWCNDGQIGQGSPHCRHNRSGRRLPRSPSSRERLCRSWHTSRDAARARLDGLIALGIRDKVALHSMSPADFQSVARSSRVSPRMKFTISQASVTLSFTQPAETLAGITLGTLNMLETLRRLRGQSPFLQCRFFRVLWRYRKTNKRRSDRGALTAWPKRRPFH